MLERPATVDNKANFLRRYLAGEFGNRLRQWETLAELRGSGYAGKVSVRPRNRAGGFFYALDANTLVSQWPLPVPVDSVYFNETPPDELLLIQGEVFRGPEGLTLTYSQIPGLSCREAINHRLPRYAWRSAAVSLLRQYLWPSSWSDLEELLDGYSDSVIEFSAWDTAVGCARCQNTVIWEVRNY